MFDERIYARNVGGTAHENRRSNNMCEYTVYKFYYLVKL